MSKISFVAMIATITTIAALTTASAQDKVSVGGTGVVSDGAVFIALERGYFKEQNLDVTYEAYKSMPEMLPLIATNRLDVGLGANGAALYNALANGTGLKIVGDGSTIQAGGRDGGGLMVRQQLVGQMKKPADLKGKTIGALGVSCVTSQLYIEKFLANSGVSPKEVSWVAMGFPEMTAGLANGAIDLAIQVEPYVAVAKAKGVASQWVGLGDMYPGQEANVVTFSDAFAAKRDIALRFFKGRLKGVRDYNDAFFKGINRAAAVQILAKNTLVKEIALYDQMSIISVDPNGRPNSESLIADQDWFVGNGCMRKAADLRAAIDTSFADEAVAAMGKY